jgi:formate hydrogenlyase transcriptional activator
MNDLSSHADTTQSLQAAQERCRLLVRLAHLVSSSLDLREVFQRLAGELFPLTGCGWISLLCREEAGGQRQGFALDLGPPECWLELLERPGEETTSAWVLRQRRTRINRRLDQAQTFTDERQLLTRGFRASVFLPLIYRNECLAVLGLAARDEKRADTWDLSLLRDLCNLLAPAVDNAAAYRLVRRLQARLEEENRSLREVVRTHQERVELIGESRPMQELRRAIAQVSATDSTVLVLGPSGTGKELVARAIHEQSSRRDGLLVKVNCSALAPGVLASELFGHEEGAFTGASKRRLGRFELAQHGSIFLDEVGDIAPETQVMLLRVLQERVLERVGGNEPIPIDVRVLAATNRDLDQAVREGRIRLDLFYRLNVFPIRVPPLCQRREDIPLLLDHFLAKLGQRMNRSVAKVSQRTLKLLQDYSWPGNVRELENLIERALIVCPGDTLEIDPSWLTPLHLSNSLTSPSSSSTLSQQERQAILDALTRAGGKIYGPGGAAELLGLKPTTLYGKMRKHRIRKDPEAPQYT